MRSMVREMRSMRSVGRGKMGSMSGEGYGLHEINREEKTGFMILVGRI